MEVHEGLVLVYLNLVLEHLSPQKNAQNGVVLLENRV